MFISPLKIRWLFMIKAIIVPITWLAMLIWAFIRVPSSQGLFQQHTQLEGAKLSWAWLSALNSALGLYATLGVNIPDFTVSFPIFCPPLFCCTNMPILGWRGMRRMRERKYYVLEWRRGSWWLLVWDRQFIQLIIIPIAFTLGGFIGIAVTSAGISLYGEVLWDPLRCTVFMSLMNLRS